MARQITPDSYVFSWKEPPNIIHRDRVITCNMLQVPTEAENMQHILCSLIGTCRLNNAESEKLLHYVIEHIQDWPANRVRDLLPWKVDLTVK